MPKGDSSALNQTSGWKTVKNTAELDASTTLPRVESVSTADERVAIYQFRYAIYIEQMGKSYPFANHELRQFSDPLDDDASILFVKKSNRVVATVRLNWGHDRLATIAFRDIFQLEQFSDLPPASLCFCSRLMIDPQYRSYRFVVTLFSAAYRMARERGVRFSFVHCSPHLQHLFLRFGFRRHGDEYQDPYAGRQIPFKLLLEDVAHLQATRSPFYQEALRWPNIEDSRVRYEKTMGRNSDGQ